MAITNEDIYKKIEVIERAVRDLRREETEVLREENLIKLEEGKLMGLLNKKVDLQFDNILDWKKYIWDICEYKKSREKDNTIDFICKKTGNKCRFVDCFRNRK